MIRRSSIHLPVLRRLIAHPFREVFRDDRRVWRGVDILAATMHIAEAIENNCRTETVGLLIPTSGLFAPAALAGWMTGRVVVPLNYLLRRGELEHVIRDCDTDTVLTIGQMIDYIGFTPNVENVIRLEELHYKSLPPPRWPAMKTPDDLAVILYTSGTSGLPKGVMLTHGNISANVRQCKAHARFTDEDVLLGVLPQFHSFGLTVLTMLPLMVGCRAVYTARFVPQQIVRMMREHRPTAFVGISSMFGALLIVKSAKAEDFASLRFAVAGGEPLSRPVAETFRERFGIPINEGYGLTETAPVTNLLLPGEDAPGSVGRPFPGMEQRIVDPGTGRTLEPGEEGEIRMRGPNIMRGYYKLDDLTRESFDGDGFFRTGDVGTMDERGFLYITGRLKEMIIVGGENVAPREIEDALDAHESVACSAAVGVFDDVRGEIPEAAVQMDDGADFDEQALKDWCKERLAPYKVPRRIHRLDELPRTGTGKVSHRHVARWVNGEMQEGELRELTGQSS